MAMAASSGSISAADGIADKMVGDCNIENRQYPENPLTNMVGIMRLRCLKTNVLDPDWRFEVLLTDNLEFVLDHLSLHPFTVSVPETVFIRVNETPNYTAALCFGVQVELAKAVDSCCFADFETGEWKTLAGGKRIGLPVFLSWSAVKFKK